MGENNLSVYCLKYAESDLSESLILAGDECYTNANIEMKRCTGAFYNKEKAIFFIEKYSNKKYYVHTCHDISLKTERII